MLEGDAIQDTRRRFDVWIRTYKWHFVIALAVVIVVEVIVQLAYPSDRLLPMAKIADTPVGLDNSDQLALVLQDQFDSRLVVLQANAKSTNLGFNQLGLSLDIDAMIARSFDYSLAYRLLPFSMFWHQTIPKNFVFTAQSSITEEALSQIASELSADAVDASIAVSSDGNITSTAAQSGYVVTSDELSRKINATNFATDDASYTLEVFYSEKKPKISDIDVGTIRQRAMAVLAQKLSITLGDDTITTTKADVAAWISIKANTSGGLALSANVEAIDKYIAELNDKYGTSPTETVVTMVDGVEKGRQVGKDGQAIDSDSLAKSLTAAITDTPSEQKVVAATLATVASPIKKVSNYTATLSGLKAYVADQTSDGSIKISVQQLDGDKWSASGGASDSFVSASTYKPFVLLRLFDDINDGTVGWSDTFDGVTYSKCLEDTIVISANYCSEALTKHYGGTTLTNYLHSRGFSSGTGFTFSDAAHTTAGDLTKLLVGLQNGTMISGDNRTRLLSAMSRQIYRQGIPAGTSGTVYDKVGFLWDYLNDAAIVQYNGHTYVLVILTKGHSWATIAQITKKIQSLMYP